MKYILIFILAIFPLFSYASENKTISAIEKKEVIESIGKRLQENYIYPKTTKQIISKLNKNLEAGVYKSIKDPNKFASKLTEDIFAVSNDLHFAIFFDSQWVTNHRKVNKPETKRVIQEKELAEAKRKNFEFRDVKLLDGNVGYLNFTYFHEPQQARETLAAAMKFLSNSDALIIDLRHNNGGYLEMVQLISSFLFTTEKTITFFDYFYIEKGKRIDEKQRILPSVPGKRMPNVDVYILTSSRTFSAAEWMAYSLKNLKRATIIGEKTAGGAHPVTRKVVSDRFSINVPIGIIKDPITKTDFEGKGIKPHFDVPSRNALFVAHIKALEKLSTTVPKENGKYSWFLPLIKSKINPVKIAQETLKSYTGNFGIRTISYENGRLYYDWNNAGKIEMIPITDDLFAIDGTDDFRFKMLKENGKYVGFMRIYQDGRKQKYLKDK